MRPRFRTRQVVQLALTANALRPGRRAWSSIPAFFAGWLTTELAPHLLALTAADTVTHLTTRRGGSDTDHLGVGMAIASTAGLTAVINSARRARSEVEDALIEALGPGYQSELAYRPDAAEFATPWPALATPFRVGHTDVRRSRDIAYADGGKRFYLDVYRPPHDVQDAPVLLQVHGGAWVLGNKNQQGLPLMRHMAARGWVCVAINYPLAPRSRWPEHILAAKRSVAWIREHIHEYGGDPRYLAVTGGSAGGHLAALLALTAGDPRFQPGFEEADTSVAACVPHYGVYDFAASSGSRASTARRNLIAKYVVGKDPAEFLDDYVQGSPLDRVHRQAPPFFVIHGARDTVVPAREARVFTQRLRDTSTNPVAYAELAGAQHAFDIFPSIRSAHVVRGVRRFLEWTYQRWQRQRAS